MKVFELIELLSKLDQDKEVTLWNCEWDYTDPIDYVEYDSKREEVVIS